MRRRLTFVAVLAASSACDLDVDPLRQDGGMRCEEGYALLDGVCRDVDECLLGNGGCDPQTACTNTEGGRRCGPCPEGFEGEGETGCVEAAPPDLCAAEDEGLHDGGGGACVPIGTCSPGYRIGVGFTCVPDVAADADAGLEDAEPADAER